MTAVEWLIENILKHDKSFVEFYNAEIEQALEMEKQQIIDAHGVKTTRGERQGISFWESKTGEQYYNETYKPSA
jgi:hypothetical protein